MTTVYDASMGVRVAKSTEGWTFQYWWTNDYNWYPLKDAKVEMLEAMRKDSLKNIPMELRMELTDEIYKVLTGRSMPSADEVNELLAKRDAEGPDSEFAQVLSAEITKGLADIKAGIAEKDGQVSVMSLEQFITNLGKLDVGMNLLGIKLMTQTGQIHPADIEVGLANNDVYVFEMHFPDMDKYEVVLRLCQDKKVRSFGYKL